MKNRSRILRLCLLAQLAALPLSSGPPGAVPPAGPNLARVVTCAFSNPRYSGWCRVTEDLPESTSGKKVCRGVLACLNNVRCIKAYCNATPIRGGWRLEQVDTGSRRN